MGTVIGSEVREVEMVDASQVVALILAVLGSIDGGLHGIGGSQGGLSSAWAGDSDHQFTIPRCLPSLLQRRCRRHSSFGDQSRTSRYSVTAFAGLPGNRAIPSPRLQGVVVTPVIIIFHNPVKILQDYCYNYFSFFLFSFFYYSMHQIEK